MADPISSTILVQPEVVSYNRNEAADLHTFSKVDENRN